MHNPFYFGNEVSESDFCNRVRELKELKSALESLLKKDVCDRKQDCYYFVDPFMAY